MSHTLKKNPREGRKIGVRKFEISDPSGEA